MIWHVKKPVTKRDREQYEEWRKKHEEESKKAEERLKKHKPKQSFFAAQAKTVSNQLAGYRETPSLPPQPPTESVKKDRILDLDHEQREEYLRREKAAQEEMEAKKSRVGPTYNKGGPQYWTEEMLKDLKGGGHRRR